MGRSLTKRQDAFIAEYVTDGNATQAALRAGYAPSSARQRGYELVNSSDIQLRLQAYGLLGLDRLAMIAYAGKNESAQLKAAIALVERAFGKVGPCKPGEKQFTIQARISPK